MGKCKHFLFEKQDDREGSYGKLLFCSYLAEWAGLNKARFFIANFRARALERPLAHFKDVQFTVI
jgi:hypothetical protein